MYWLVHTPSLSAVGWDEHQDKQGLASIGLLWCVSRPRPRPHEQCDGDVPTDLCWLVVPWPENRKQSVFPLSWLYIDVYSERISECVSHHPRTVYFLPVSHVNGAVYVNDVTLLVWHILKGPFFPLALCNREKRDIKGRTWKSLIRNTWEKM